MARRGAASAPAAGSLFALLTGLSDPFYGRCLWALEYAAGAHQDRRCRSGRRVWPVRSWRVLHRGFICRLPAAGILRCGAAGVCRCAQGNARDPADAPFGWDTLGVRIHGLTAEGDWARAPCGLTLVLVGLLFVIVLIRRQHDADSWQSCKTLRLWLTIPLLTHSLRKLKDGAMGFAYSLYDQQIWQPGQNGRFRRLGYALHYGFEMRRASSGNAVTWHVPMCRT